MLGFLLTIKGILAHIMELGWWLVFGAGLATAGAVFRGWLGYAGVAIGGAVIMFFAISNHWLGDDSDRIKRLENQIRWEQAKRAEIEATNKQLQKDLAEEAEVAEFNAGILADLHAQIEAMEDRPECGVGEEFTDELKKLR